VIDARNGAHIAAPSEQDTMTGVPAVTGRPATDDAASTTATNLEHTDLEGDHVPGTPIVVLDTSTLVADPDALGAYPDCDVVLPLRVIEELDGLKNRSDEVGWLARRAIRSVEQLRVNAGGSLAEPITLPHGGTLRVAVNGVAKGLLVAHDLDPESSDNRIIGAALGLAGDSNNVRVVSNDASFRIKAAHLGLEAHEHHPVEIDPGNGYVTVETTSDVIDDLYNGGVDAKQFAVLANQFAILRAGKQSGLARERGGILHPLRNDQHAWGAHGRNVAQKMAIDILLDPDIPIVCLDGPAGTGKTLLALAAGLEQVIEKPVRYERLSIFRSLVPVGREDIGFLPGDIADKTMPHFSAMLDAVRALLPETNPQEVERFIEQLITKKQLTMEPVSFLRGRSLASTFIIVDEAQNLERAVVKTLLTRVSTGTKIVLTGDTSQIDNPFTSASNNAMTALVGAFTGQELFGHVRLTTCERSKVASLAAELL
jgi:PhoH-like ATPase